jgi:hypothetical protein
VHACFAEKLMLHAKTEEEEVLYSDAILVGEYLKLKLEEITTYKRFRGYG